MIKKNDISATGYFYLQQGTQTIMSAIEEIRNLSHSMIAPFMEKTTMKEAIENMILSIESTSGIKINMESSGLDEEKLSEKLRLTTYRIIQEQFSNVLKYSKASLVSLKIFQDNEKLSLIMQDNGVGVDPSKKTSGIGLMNIKTRASLFKGETNIHSSPGQGFELSVVMRLA
jgi:signal transduction histidine kinase